VTSLIDARQILSREELRAIGRELDRVDAPRRLMFVRSPQLAVFQTPDADLTIENPVEHWFAVLLHALMLAFPARREQRSPVGRDDKDAITGIDGGEPLAADDIPDRDYSAGIIAGDDPLAVRRKL